ncbi:MAG: hypothetical protein MUF31_04145 [Akkermansiaceae bacterium]|jgi:hypothetical protein|nr:hypothetical protein [Akkermansiaceae bacterium]
MPDQPPQRTPLPDSLRQQLEDFRRHLWRAKIAEAVLAGLLGLLLSFLIVFGLDRIWPTPGVLRLVILLAGTSLCAVFAPIWLHRWVWRHRRANQLARLISRKHPGLGDRLLGVIDLAAQEEGADTMSPRLRAAAMEAVAAEAAQRKLDDSLPVSRHRRWSLAVLVLLLAAGGALVSMPQAGLNALKRWLFPLSATPRYTFTTLQPLPSEMPVAIGEAFTLKVGLDATSQWQPATATARLDKQDPLVSPLADGSYLFEFPGQQDRARLRLEVGDAVHDILILPSQRPSIGRSLARITFPPYLERKDETLELATGLVQAVEGSKVRLTIEASRRLTVASFGPLLPLDPEAPLPKSAVEAMEIDGSNATTAPIQVGTTALRIPLSWKDDLGLEGAPGFELRLDAAADEAPAIYFDGSVSQHAMLPEETIDFVVNSGDDFGLKEIGLEWLGEPSLPGGGPTTSGELVLKKGEPDLARTSTPAAFSPAALGITPQKIVLRAYAVDYLPGRPRSYSQPITLFVMTREEHAQMLKNRFDRSLGELEDLARRERNLFEENQRLERLEAPELREEANQRRLQKQQDEERRQAESMQELAEQMESLLKDSARNQTIDPETLRRMSETMESMRELGKEQIPGVEEKLKDSTDPKNSEEKTERDMDEAVERQKETLEKMQETLDNANDANQRFEASTFVARLKRASEDQSRITQGAIAGSEHFGLRPEELDPAILTLLEELGRLQATTTSDIRWIQEDLGHFFTRSENPAFGKVLAEMNDSNIAIALEDIRRRIAANQGYTASEQSDHWANKLRDWAKLLEDAAGDQGGGGGGGGGGSQEDEDFEFMLRVMRLVQQEQDLRARTRALETLRRSIEETSKP